MGTPSLAGHGHETLSALLASRFRQAATRLSQAPETAPREDSDNELVSSTVLDIIEPQWNHPRWLDTKVRLQGFCLNVVTYDHEILSAMLASDHGVKLIDMDLTIKYRSKPFDKGRFRTASYAQTTASTDRFVVKSFIQGDRGTAHVQEDMRMQAVCKAFALEFNALLGLNPPLDFAVTSCLVSTSGRQTCLSMEPYIPGEYVKYNSNAGYVLDRDSKVNEAAQAFSHFTFERSLGHMLVSDLQGVGYMLTDPAIHSLDDQRFKLSDKNLGEEGMMCFMATHQCNSYCTQLQLESKKEMFIDDIFTYRASWPYMKPTFCCANRLCQAIIQEANTKTLPEYPNRKWCQSCWMQLQQSVEVKSCDQCGTSFDANAFYHESQGEPLPTACPTHREETSSDAGQVSMGAARWASMQHEDTEGSIASDQW